MVMGSPLVAGEDGKVDWVLEVVHCLFSLGVGGADALAEEYHGTSGAAERFVGCGGDDVGVRERGGDDASGDEAGDVRHVDDEVGADEVGDLSDSGVVDESAVGGGAGDDGLGAVEDRGLFKHIVVDYAGREVDAVGHRLEVGGYSGDPGMG